MLKSVKISNFQSLKDVELVLGPLTVIYGESNKGKSAIIRALQAWAFNVVPKGFIFQGEKSAAVEVELEEGHRVTWMKGLTARYIVDEGSEREQVFTKIGRTVPPEVTDLIGLRRIEVDQTRLYPQLADQHDPPFLLKESEGKAARVLSRMTRLDVVLNAAASANRDLKRAKQRLADAHAQMRAKEQQREQYADLPEREQRLAELEETYKGLLDAEGVLEEARIRNEQREALDAMLAEPTVDTAEVDELLSIVDFAVEARDQFNALQRAQVTIAETSREIARLEQEIGGLTEQLKKYRTCPTCGQLVCDD